MLFEDGGENKVFQYATSSCVYAHFGAVLVISSCEYCIFHSLFLVIFRGVPICAPRWPDMQLPHVFIAFFMCDQAFPHVFITFWDPLGFLLGAHWGLTCNFLMCLLHFSCVIKHFLMCLLHFWHPQASFWSPLGSLGVSFSACWRGCGASWASFGAKMEPETSR